MGESPRSLRQRRTWEIWLREIVGLDERVWPDAVDQLVAAHHLSRALGERQQRLDGLRREGDHLPVAEQHARLGVEHEHAERVRPGAAGRGDSRIVWHVRGFYPGSAVRCTSR
jgi:hypothetical protein